MANEYRVEKGLSYTPDGSDIEVRAEIGDTISDLPSSAIAELVAITAISTIEKKTPSTKAGK